MPRTSTKKDSTTSKKTTEAKATVDKEKEILKTQNEQLTNMLKEMQEQLEALKKQAQTPTIVQTVGSSGKKVKVVSLTSCVISVSTEENGEGKAITFNKYGDIRTVKFDDLADMVASYPNAFEKGYIYINDPAVVAELGLDDVYQDIHTKKDMDKILKLDSDESVEGFKNLDTLFQKIIARDLATRLMNGEKLDRNRIQKIKDDTNIDIEAMAEDIKESYSKPEDK